MLPSGKTQTPLWLPSVAVTISSLFPPCSQETEAGLGIFVLIVFVGLICLGLHDVEKVVKISFSEAKELLQNTYASFSVLRTMVYYYSKWMYKNHLIWISKVRF